MIELEIAGARVVFTTRRGGFSEPPYESLNIGRLTEDGPSIVERNIAAVSEKIEASSIQFLRQVHGNEIHVADQIAAEMPEADAAITSRPGLALAATGADCPPVALGDGERVAIIHCGWRPVAAGLIEKVAQSFDDGFLAAIGPGICQRHFEVGPEVIEQIGETAQANVDGRQLDLRGVISDRLRAAGAGQVADVDRCTYCEPDEFYSYRRDGGSTGRQAGIVWRS